MESTRITLTPGLKSRMAIGHALPSGRVGRDYFEFLPGAGGLLSTANDLNKFISAYLGLSPSPLSSLMNKAEAFHSMEDGTKRRLAWGSEETLFSQNGLTCGYRAALGFDARKRRGVVVLSNCSSMDPIVDSRPFLDGRSPRPDNTISIDPRLYDRFVGQYRKTLLFGLIHFGPTLSISHVTDELGDHLVASARGLPGFNVAEFFPVSKTSFVVNPMSTADDIRLTFIQNKKGKATRVIVTWNGSKHRVSRISDQPAK